VKRIPFSLACIETTYDITKPQPQLFVAESFEQLIEALEELAKRMAFRLGGADALARAKKAATVTTVQMDSGVQVSGVLADFRVVNNQPAYVQFKGPTQLSFEDAEFPGQGADYHREGFGSPVGLLSDGRSPDTLTEADLSQGRLKFKSGVEVVGRLKSLTRKNKTLIASFTDCTVTLGKEILFKPEWGVFDMICGDKVVSAFGGAADRKQYLAKTGGFHQDPGKQKSNLTPENRALNELYARIRKVRESGKINVPELEAVHKTLEVSHPTDWLLRFEILEIVRTSRLAVSFESQIRSRLAEISKISLDRAEMILRGLSLVDRSSIAL
jgi:phenylalanine-4-hydroxylase